MSSVTRRPTSVQSLHREESYRLFNCVRCNKQARLCRRCDRGNRYCGAECASRAHKDSVRKAGAAYQRTEAGRKNHAARQQAFLERREAKMTHQGSPSLVEAPSSPAPEAMPAEDQERCHETVEDSEPIEQREETSCPAGATAPPAQRQTTRALQGPAPRSRPPRPKRCCGCGAPLPPLARRRFLRKARGSPGG